MAQHTPRQVKSSSNTPIWRCYKNRYGYKI